MATSWKDLSADDKKKYGTKKDYMRATGQGKQGERAAAKEKAQARQEEQSQQNKPDVPEMVKHEASGKMIKNPALLNKHEQAAVDDRKAEQKKTANYNDLAQRMGEADAQRRYMNNEQQQQSQGQFKEEFSGAMKNMTPEQRRSFSQARQKATKNYRQEENQAYQASRAEMQQQMDQVGRAGVYEYQSAKDIQNRDAMEFSNLNAEGKEHKEDRYALIRTFQNSGYDYNHADVLRHMDGGAERHDFKGLYDDYGGYENWYNNHSIYSGENAQVGKGKQNAKANTEGEMYQYNLGNFTGSKDIMSQDEVMKQGGARQQANKEFVTSNKFAEKYGKYDWAQDQIFDANATAQERHNKRLNEGYKGY